MKQQRKQRAKRPFEAPKITEARSLDIGQPPPVSYVNGD
jgi:hypothetical protein